MFDPDPDFEAPMFDVEYSKLMQRETVLLPKVGDRVLVAIGILGFGSICARDEGVCIECASTTYKIRFYNPEEPDDSPDIWVHQNLILDILEPLNLDSENE
jgi:hypothetical protein